MAELRECICGGEMAERTFDGYDALQCDKCGIVVILPGSGTNNEKLITAWNTRAYDAEHEKVCNRMKAAMYDLEQAKISVQAENDALRAEMEGLRAENKRNIPIPPILETKDADGEEYEFLHFRCPRCKNVLHQHFRRSKAKLGLPICVKYCMNCGQHLEWDNLGLRAEAEAALEKEANHE